MPVGRTIESNTTSIHAGAENNSGREQSSSPIPQSSARTQQPLRLTAPLPDSEDSPDHRRLIAADLHEISNALVDHLSFRIQRVVDGINRWSSSSIDTKELKKLAEARTILRNHVIPPLCRYPMDNTTGRIGTNTTVSTEDAAKISRAYEVAAKMLPKGDIRELTGLLGQHIKTAWEQMKVDEIKADTIKNLEPYRKPETYRSDRYSVEATLGLGTPAMEANDLKFAPLDLSIRQTFGLSKKNELYTDPEGLVFLNKHSIKSWRGNGELGMELPKSANARIDGGVEVSKDDVKLEMFNTIDDYVEKKGHTRYLAKASRDEYKDVLKPKSPPAHSEIANLKADQQHATDNRERLNHLLKNTLNLPHADVNAPAPDRGRALAGHSSTITAIATGKVAGGVVNVTGNVNVSVTRSVFDFHLYAPSQFTAIIQKNPKRLDELPKTLLAHAKNSLASTEENSPQRQQLAMLKLRDMNNDLKTYYGVVKELDGLRYRQNTGITARDKKKEKELVSEKHRIENKWHAIGRHNFLQTLSASHALLAINAMPTGIEHSDEAKKAVTDTADALKNPDIDYDKKRLNESAAFDRDIILQTRSTRISAGGGIEAFGQSGSLNYTREWQHRIHPSRVRQGDYVNRTWTATGNISANAPVAEFAQRLQQTAADGNSSSSVTGELADILNGDSSNAHYSQSRSRITRDYLPEYRQDPDYQGGKEYHTQFTRTTKTTTYGGRAGGTGPVAAGINLGGSTGYEHANSTITTQTLGTDDLSFVFNMLNRMDKNRANNPEELDNFFNEHKTEFEEIFHKLGDPATEIHKESRHFLNEMIEKASASERDRMNDALETVFRGKQESSKKDAALKALKDFTGRDSTREEKDRAHETLKASVHAIPWDKIKEATPPTGTLATLGLGGKKLFGKKIIPGNGLSTKQEKAEKALNTLLEARNANLFETGSRKKPGSEHKHAIKTLTRLFEALDAESETDKAGKTLSGFIEKYPSESEEYQNVKTSLLDLSRPNNDSDSSPTPFKDIMQKTTLHNFIDDHAETVSEKEKFRVFSQSFNETMSDYRLNPNPANFSKAKSMFFDFHKKQTVPWNEAHISTWLDVPFTKKKADQALDFHTRVLKTMGIHPRVKEQQGT